MPELRTWARVRIRVRVRLRLGLCPRDKAGRICQHRYGLIQGLS